MIRHPRALLFLLTALNLLNYLDRFVLAAVLPEVQNELHLTNFVAGGLATVFLVGYFSTSPSFGLIADRGPRRFALAAGVFVWSAATIATGLVSSAWGLVVMRALVGIGEAAYATIAPTIIDDVAPRDKKGGWLAIYFSAVPIGSALGYLVGGQVGQAFGWRNAFFVAGCPGIAFAIACLFLVEPPREIVRERLSLKQTFQKLWKVAQYRTTILGYCAYTFALGGFAFWAPSFVYRVYGIELKAANMGIGAITVVAGLLGTAVGGIAKDRLTRVARMKANAGDENVVSVNASLRVCAISSAIAAPLALACFLAPSAKIFFACAFLCEFALFANSSPINIAILHSVPERYRASAMALGICMIHLFGDLWSPPLIGVIADWSSLRVGAMVFPIAIALSAVIWFAPRRLVRQTSQNGR